MNKDYRFEVYTDYCTGERQYIVKYIDFETVIGGGDTIEEAIEEAEGNLEFYLEYCEEHNIEVPEPSNHDYELYSGKVTLRMSKSLHQKVNDRARREGVSINSLLNEAIAEYIERKSITCMLAENDGFTYKGELLTHEKLERIRKKMKEKK
ncbi:MAG: toxin-antitoxin system HicB family antitoxin [Bacilli bacterium]|nr:toxin-antitoxin system HicB family antitoxin [Bacilli bacterium]